MLRVGCRYLAVSPIYMSNDRLEPFNYHNIAFKRCADVVSLGRLDRLWFFLDIIDSWKLVGLGKMGFKAQTCWTDLLAFWGVWNRSRIVNFGPDRLFFRFSRALPGGPQLLSTAFSRQAPKEEMRNKQWLNKLHIWNNNLWRKNCHRVMYYCFIF